MEKQTFYIVLSEYPSVEVAAASIYLFLKKNVLFEHHLVIVCNEGVDEDDKKNLSSLYYDIQFRDEYDKVFLEGTKLSDYDWTLSSDEILKNEGLIEEFNKWIDNYFFEKDIFFPKHSEDADKYIVCTCAKNENKYILEWIEHYLNLGFDKIIICDNNDEPSLEHLLLKYIEEGTVEIFNCHHFEIFQERMYQMFCEEGNYKWCAYFDCDEFLELGVYSDIKEYLASKTEDCLAFNWVIFGSDGQLDKKQGKVSERFKVPYLPLLNIYNGFLKGIVRGGRFRFRNIEFKGGHLPYPTDDEIQLNTYNVGGTYSTGIAPYQTSYPLRYKEGYIKHYYTKSFEEWIDKARRGWPINTKSLPFYRYFCLESSMRMKKNWYEKNLFLSDEWLNINSKGVFEFFNEHNVDMIELTHKKTSTYGFVSFILYIMSQFSEKTILVKSEKIDDFLFATLLEYAFVTNNRVVYCKDDNEVDKAYCKYRKDENSVYLWEVL